MTLTHKHTTTYAGWARGFGQPWRQVCVGSRAAVMGELLELHGSVEISVLPIGETPAAGQRGQVRRGYADASA